MADGYYKKVNSTPATAPTISLEGLFTQSYQKEVDASTKYQQKEVDTSVNLDDYMDIEITYEPHEDVPWYEAALNWVGDALVSTGASIANTAVGLVQGLGEFGEAIIDTAAILGTGVASVFTGLYDAGQWITGKITGNEDWESATKKMWDGTMGFVSTKYVSNAFDSFHQNNVVGKWLDDKSFSPFKSTGAVYQIADGVGYIAGVIGLTVLTFGVGGAATAATSGTTAAAALTPTNMAITAATVGIGKNTQKAWSEGANLGEGLTYGIGMSAFEGLEMYLGGKINALKVTDIPGLKGQLINSGTHVLLDSVDGAANAFVDPIFQSMYQPTTQEIERILYIVNHDENGNQISNKTWDDLNPFEKYGALFEYNGGWKTVGTRALSAAAISFATEIPSIIKSAKAPVVKYQYNDKLSPELNEALERLQSKSPVNAARMKTEILASIDGIDDPVLKAKKLYNELNKRLNYSIAYMSGVSSGGDRALADSIYSQTLSFANLNGDSVICKGWSDLYRELLIDAGFDEKSIITFGGNSMGSHKWIGIDLGQGQTLVADATNNMLGTTDLFTAKMGLPSRGFMVLDNTTQSWSPLALYKNNVYGINDWEGWARQLDGTLGITDISGYEYERILQASRTFGDPALASQVLGGTPAEFASNRVLQSVLPETMDGLEAYQYYRNMLRTVRNETGTNVANQIIPMLYSSNTTAAAEAISIVQIIDSSNKSTYKVYGKNIGNIIIDSEEQFQEFVSNLQFVMKG